MERIKLNAVMDFMVFNLLAPRARVYMNEIGGGANELVKERRTKWPNYRMVSKSSDPATDSLYFPIPLPSPVLLHHKFGSQEIAFDPFAQLYSLFLVRIDGKYSR